MFEITAYYLWYFIVFSQIQIGGVVMLRDTMSEEPEKIVQNVPGRSIHAFQHYHAPGLKMEKTYFKNVTYGLLLATCDH